MFVDLARREAERDARRQALRDHERNALMAKKAELERQLRLSQSHDQLPQATNQLSSGSNSGPNQLIQRKVSAAPTAYPYGNGSPQYSSSQYQQNRQNSSPSQQYGNSVAGPPTRQGSDSTLDRRPSYHGPYQGQNGYGSSASGDYNRSNGYDYRGK